MMRPMRKEFAITTGGREAIEVPGDQVIAGADGAAGRMRGTIGGARCGFGGLAHLLEHRGGNLSVGPRREWALDGGGELGLEFRNLGVLRTHSGGDLLRNVGAGVDDELADCPVNLRSEVRVVAGEVANLAVRVLAVFEDVAVEVNGDGGRSGHG